MALAYDQASHQIPTNQNSSQVPLPETSYKDELAAAIRQRLFLQVSVQFLTKSALNASYKFYHSDSH